MLARLKTYGQALALLLVLGGSASAEDTLAKAREEGTIRVGVGLMGTKPIVWQDSDGKYVGIEADLTRELVKRLGIKHFDYVVTEWSTLIPGLKAGRWDLLVTGMVKSEERIQGGGIAMSRPYMMVYDRIIVNQDSPIESEADLKGKVLGSTLGTTDSIVAHSIVAKGAAAEVKDFNTYAEPFLALRNKQVDAVIFDQMTYKGFKESMNGLKMVGDPLFYLAKPEWAEAQKKADYKLGAVAVGLRADDTALLQAVNKALGDMDIDGTRKQIFEKYDSWDDQQSRDAMMK